MTTSEDWISFTYGLEKYIGKRCNGEYISCSGFADNWEWKPATQDEIDYFEKKSLLKSSLFED